MGRNCEKLLLFQEVILRVEPPKNADHHQRLEEARMASPLETPETVELSNTLLNFGLLGLQNAREYIYFVDKSSVCGNLWLSLEVTQHLRAQSIVIAQE